MDITQTSVATALSILVGLLLVFFGRRLFWVFVGVVGFLMGLHVAPAIVSGQPQWVVLVAGVVLGIIGAVLAVVFQRVAVAVAGWSAGGILASRMAVALGWNDPMIFWGAFILGAVLAAVIVSLLFDWALIALTALSGALLVCDHLAFALSVEWIIGAVLVVLGIIVQARDLLNARSAPGTGPGV